MLPTGRLFGRIIQKGPNKRQIGRTKLQPNICRFCTERAVKGPNFFSHARRHIKKIFISLNAVKKPNLVGGRIFFSAAEFFRRTGRKVLLKVGNTIRNMVRIHGANRRDLRSWSGLAVKSKWEKIQLYKLVQCLIIIRRFCFVLTINSLWNTCGTLLINLCILSRSVQ